VKAHGAATLSTEIYAPVEDGENASPRLAQELPPSHELVSETVVPRPTKRRVGMKRHPSETSADSSTPAASTTWILRNAECMAAFDPHRPGWREGLMRSRMMLLLSAISLVGGCAPSPPLAEGLESSPVTIELGTDPRALPPDVPGRDELPDAPRLFSIKY
jgi:hypothetical protein